MATVPFIWRHSTTAELVGPTPQGPLNQDAIDRAFANKQRASQDVYFWGRVRVTVLSGKNSGRLGVQQHVHGNSAVEITGLERTLIDLTVRPDYAGGPGQVLEAFRRSQPRLSVDRLLGRLTGLGYRYPYHQAIGFYMERAGYGENELAKLEAVGTNLDFYIGYGMEPENSTPNGAFTFLGIFESSGWADTLGPRSRRRLPSCSVESCRRPAAIEAATDD